MFQEIDFEQNNTPVPCTHGGVIQKGSEKMKNNIKETRIAIPSNPKQKMEVKVMDNSRSAAALTIAWIVKFERRNDPINMLLYWRYQHETRACLWNWEI